ncbi:hypothetical protein LTR08_008044 [Meristemomyces frigidus]|nr:hypothetical protein LTR08_008044 [Meristemomyces frigidus]
MSSNETVHPAYNDPTQWVLYRYTISLPAAAIFIALFTCVTAAHAFLMGMRRTWCFIPFLIGGCFELSGYVARAVSSSNQWALGPYIAQTLLLLLAPALFAASIYMVLGQIIAYVDGERHSLIRKKWLTKAFVTGDVISFLLQMAGGGIMAVGNGSSAKLGQDIIIVGLFAQIVFFGLFIVVTITFHRRFVRHEPEKALLDRQVWHRQLWALYIGSMLILIRSIVRVVEYLMGNDGFILRREYFLYVFDATPMFLVMALFIIVHPSRLAAAKRAGYEASPHSEHELISPKESR